MRRSRKLARSRLLGCVMTDRLLDANEVAELLNVPVSWVRESTRSGAMPCVERGAIGGTSGRRWRLGSRLVASRAERSRCVRAVGVMRFAARTAGYSAAHIGGPTLGVRRLGAIDRARGTPASGLCRAKPCIRPLEVLLSAVRDSDHAPIQIVRCSRPAGSRAVCRSSVCARRPIG